MKLWKKKESRDRQKLKPNRSRNPVSWVTRESRGQSGRFEGSVKHQSYNAVQTRTRGYSGKVHIGKISDGKGGTEAGG